MFLIKVRFERFEFFLFVAVRDEMDGSGLIPSLPVLSPLESSSLDLDSRMWTAEPTAGLASIYLHPSFLGNVPRSREVTHE